MSCMYAWLLLPCIESASIQTFKSTVCEHRDETAQMKCAGLFLFHIFEIREKKERRNPFCLWTEGMREEMLD